MSGCVLRGVSVASVAGVLRKLDGTRQESWEEKEEISVVCEDENHLGARGEVRDARFGLLRITRQAEEGRRVDFSTRVLSPASAGVRVGV